MSTEAFVIQPERLSNLDYRIKLMMLALMNDGLDHFKDAITTLVSRIDLISISNAEFAELIKSTNGHGGGDIDGKCSICLKFTNGDSI